MSEPHRHQFVRQPDYDSHDRKHHRCACGTWAWDWAWEWQLAPRYLRARVYPHLYTTRSMAAARLEVMYLQGEHVAP